jgi:ABC-type glycerol-3-phosphate transport system permease component
MASRRGAVVRRLPRWLGMAILTIVVLGPLYWVVMSSFKTRQEIILRSPTWFPREPTLESYRRLFTTTQYPVLLSNSAKVAVATTVITLVLSIGAAYGLYRLRVPGSGRIAGAVLLSYMIPGTLLIVPLYQVLTSISLLNNLWGLVLVNVAFTAPFCTWLMRGFIDAVPDDLDEAAALDGAGPVRTLLSVVMPLLAPGMATVSVYSFVYSWTEFVFASQFIISDANKTLPIGLKAIVGQYTVDWSLVMAATVFTMLPTVILFLFAGRYFVSGLISGASK